MSWLIGMPNLGHTMEEGRVQEWLKKPGEPVRAGEVIAIVESDKASFDIESPADGVMLAIDVPAEQMARVGDRIAVVGRAGESVPDLAMAVAPLAPAPAPAATERRSRVSPAACALAEELCVDLSGRTGSGEEGLITRDDVRAWAAATAPASQMPAGRKQPLSPMRAAIAAATQASWTRIPQVALQSHAKLDALPPGLPLTAAVIKACALALHEHPNLNGWLHDDGFEVASGADIAVAVDTEQGLLTPVLRQAQDKAVVAIANELRALAGRARQGRLGGEQSQGASFTVSSLGRWGVDSFAPLIAAPQVAILGVGRTRTQPHPDGHGGLRFCQELPLSLVFDHRANDGVAAARLLAAIVHHLEQPVGLELP